MTHTHTTHSQSRYTTSGLNLLSKVMLALASSTFESRSEVLFDMLHSALTWSKQHSPLASPTPPSSPRTSSYNIWSSDTISQKTDSSPSKDDPKEDENSDDDNDDNVDTKRCTNLTMPIEDSTENQKSLHHQNQQHDPNLNPPIVSIVHALCQSLQKTLSGNTETLPLDVLRALVVSVLAMTLNDEDEKEVEEETSLGRHNISRDLISELLKTTKSVLNWKNAPCMDSKSRLQYRRLLSAFGIVMGSQIMNGFLRVTKDTTAENILQSPLLPKETTTLSSVSSSSLKAPKPITQRLTSRISFIQRFIAGKSNLETWLSRYVREKKISRRWGGSSAIILCRSVAAALFVRLGLLST